MQCGDWKTQHHLKAETSGVGIESEDAPAMTRRLNPAAPLWVQWCNLENQRDEEEEDETRMDRQRFRSSALEFSERDKKKREKGLFVV